MLTEIKPDPQLKHMPVVVLTSSDIEDHILRSYARHANAYIQKPSAEPFSKLIGKVVDFWLTTAKLPPRQ